MLSLSLSLDCNRWVFFEKITIVHKVIIVSWLFVIISQFKWLVHTDKMYISLAISSFSAYLKSVFAIELTVFDKIVLVGNADAQTATNLLKHLMCAYTQIHTFSSELYWLLCSALGTPLNMRALRFGISSPLIKCVVDSASLFSNWNPLICKSSVCVRNLQCFCFNSYFQLIF